MNSEGLNAMETDAMDTNEPPNEEDPTISVKEASQVLHNEKGRGVSTKASSVAKDSYLSFLLLRHLKTRDMRTMVGGREGQNEGGKTDGTCVHACMYLIC